MNGLYHQQLNGIDILVIDYSAVAHEEEFKLMKHSLKYISRSDNAPYHVLEIISQVKLTHEMLDYLPEYIEQIKPFISKWASVGIGIELVKKMPHLPLYSRQSRSIKNKNIQWFESKEEAIAFLTT